MTKRWHAKVWVLGLALFMLGAGARAEAVIYPPSESAKDGRDAYPVRLLALALGKSGKRYTLQAHPQFMLQARAMAELEANRDLDVIWTMTSAEREARLLPIRIPIDKGLLGWRLLLMRGGDAQRLADAGPAGLRKLVAGQGHDWPDTGILQNAGFDVKVTHNYRELFLMLSSGAIDYFPRSVQEIWGEVENYKDLRLAVEPTMVLHYPTAMYFFVSRQNGALAESIRHGLEVAIADGSFERLFMEHFSAVISRSKLEARQIIDITNPQLPALTPVKDKRYWLQFKPNPVPR